MIVLFDIYAVSVDVFEFGFALLRSRIMKKEIAGLGNKISACGSFESKVSNSAQPS